MITSVLLQRERDEKCETEQHYLHGLLGGREVFIEPHVLYGHLGRSEGVRGCRV